MNQSTRKRIIHAVLDLWLSWQQNQIFAVSGYNSKQATLLLTYFNLSIRLNENYIAENYHKSKNCEQELAEMYDST